VASSSTMRMEAEIFPTTLVSLYQIKGVTFYKPIDVV
jgi:hypothetical protein